MPIAHRPRRVALTASAAAAVLAFTGCGSSSPQGAPSDTATPSAGSAPAANYPVTVDNCGEDLVIAAQPKRVVILASTSIGLIEAAGGLDQVVARTGNLTGDYWSTEARTAMEKTKWLTPSTGETSVSREIVAETQPDLVIGFEGEALNRANLKELGIPMYVIPTYCPKPPTQVSFENVYDSVTTFGKIFGHPETAAASVEKLRAQVKEITDQKVPSVKAAAIFARESGGAINAYGTGGMPHAQLEALGLVDVFGDQKVRQMETSAEVLVQRAPEVLIVAYTEGQDPAAVRKSVTGLPGASSIPAIAKDRIITIEVALGDPPNPYSIEGLRRLHEQITKLDIGK